MPAVDPTVVRAKVRQYLAAQPAPARRMLKAVRQAIRRAVPGAEEAFSYGIPGFRFQGKPLVWYAGWTHHVSLYPLTPGMRRTHGVEIARHDTSKGTLRLSQTEPLPMGLIGRLARARAAEIRAAASKPRR